MLFDVSCVLRVVCCVLLFVVCVFDDSCVLRVVSCVLSCVVFWVVACCVVWCGLLGGSLL